MLFSSIPHRELTLLARLDSSPEEYFLKKLTGSDRIRIMTDAPTAWDVFVLIRSISRDRTISIIWEEKALASRNIARPVITFRFRLLSTVPVIRLYTRGSIMPTSVTASVASAIRITSLLERLFFMYSSRSGMPSFFMGSGW